MAAQPDSMMQMLAHHDAAIGGLSSRIGHVEKTLVDHGTVLHRIENAVTKQDAKPTFDFHRTVGTVTTLAVLFSMVCGGIIWITTSQFASMATKVDRHDAVLERMAEKLGWTARVEPRK